MYYLVYNNNFYLLQCIPYTTLLQELDLNNVRDLEDLIIEAVYADIIHGKLDQKNSQLEVDYAIGRDIRSDDINVIVNCLQEWCSACEGVLGCVESQINRANTSKNSSVQRKTNIEQEVVCLFFVCLPFNCSFVSLDCQHKKDVKNTVDGTS